MTPEERWKELTERARTMPLVELQAFVDGLSREQKRSLAEHLAGQVEYITRVASYIDARYAAGYSDPGHDKAVKRQNTVARQVRRAFGYNRTNDVRF